MGWRHSMELEEGIKLAYKDFLGMLEDKSRSNRL
jgi:hypothetical protein